MSKVTTVRFAIVVAASVLCLALVLGAASAVAAAAPPPAQPVAPAPAAEPGTIGLGFAQLYVDAQANKRGPLVVLQVADGLPGDKAGIKRGDLVVAIDGADVAGRELPDIMKTSIRGPVGGTVRLTVSAAGRPDAEVALVRVPYPPHASQPGDPFAYVIPGPWRIEPRYPFPLPWAPALSYKGGEDLAFAPNFDDTASPEYHSYAFFWWLEGKQDLGAERLAADMTAYFQGLAKERGSASKFVPDLGKVTATYEADRGGSGRFGGEAARALRGRVAIYDTHGQVITLHSEVVAAFCPASGHTAAFFGMSLEPADGEIWKSLHAIRDSFRCTR